MYIVIELILTVKDIVLAFVVSWIRFFISPHRKDVRGEIVLVTGAGNGIGRELSIQFAKLGATVVLWDIDEKGMAGTKKTILSEGGVCFTYYCDIGDRDQVDAVGDNVKAEVGDVTILVNNAGVVSGKKVVDLTAEDIENTFNANLFGVIWVTKKFLPSMTEHNHGHIVNMASSCGIIGVAQLADYSASKSGVIGFTEVLSYEMTFGGFDGVHTTLVCPSYVKTGMFDGCHMAYPAILSDLELQPTITRIISAILTNQTHLCVPRLVYVMAMLKTLLPTAALLEFIRFCKADKFMDSFIGRSKVLTPLSQIPDSSKEE